MATSLRTKHRIFDLNWIIVSMLNKVSNFDHKCDISFSPTQYKRKIRIENQIAVTLLDRWVSEAKIRFNSEFFFNICIAHFDVFAGPLTRPNKS